MGFLAGLVGAKNNFKAQEANLDKSKYGDTINQAQQGALDSSKFNQVFGQQQNLNQQYGDVAAGRGPNPAQEMLRQQTSQNVNMAQGQAASQRGVNPALAARMAVDSAAGQNQQAAGQGATLQAQQSLAALGQQAGVLGQMQQGANAQQALQNQVLATAGGLQNQQNNAVVANTLGTNQINAGVAAQNADISSKLAGGLLNAGGAALGVPMMAAEGGVVPAPEQPEMAGLEEVPAVHGYMDSLESLARPPVQQFAGGGMPQPTSLSFGTPPLAAPEMKPTFNLPSAPQLQMSPQWDNTPVAEDPGAAAKAKSGRPFANSPFQMGDSTHAFDRFARMGIPRVMAEGGPVPMNFVEGGGVPGQARVAGDSTRNDIVPALLSPGEAVIPRTVMQSENPPAQAAAFVQHLLRRKGQGGSFGKAFGRRMADGGKVESEETPEKAPKLTDAISGWWHARGTDSEEQHARNVDEAVNALLPSLVSGRKALLRKRADLGKLDAATAE